MGLYDREYYREDQARIGLMGGATPACKWIIAINIAMFVLQSLTRRYGTEGPITEWLWLDPARVIGRFEIWRLVTYAFCHDSGRVWHILGNMLFLWICGRNVEPIYGSREFAKFYLASAVFSGVCFTIFGLAIGDSHPSLGASGAVMAVTMVCALWYPSMTILLMFVIPIPIRWFVALVVIFDLHPVLLQLGGTDDRSGVAHTAHLGGLLFGYLYKKYDLRSSRLFAGWQLPRFRKLVRRATSRGPQLKAYVPPPEPAPDLDRQVDEILAKISTHGEASLTDAERSLLKQASERYKRR